MLVLGFAQISFAQQYDPVDWSFEAKAVSGDEYDLVYKAKIDKGWYVYSQYLPSDEGPVATSVEYEGEKAFTTSGKSTEAGDKKSGYDAMFDMDVVKFKKDYTITQRIKVTDASKPVTGYLTFMTCNDKMCLPPTDVDFSIKLPAGSAPKAEEKPATTVTTTPAPEPTPPKTTTTITTPTPAPVTTQPTTTITTPQTTTTNVATGRDLSAEAEKKAAVQKEIDAEYAKRKAAADNARKEAQEQARKQREKQEAAAKSAQEKIAKEKADMKKAVENAIDKADGGGTALLDLGIDNAANDGILQPVKWGFGSKKLANGEYELIFSSKVDKGWYVYSQYLESDEGPVATTIEYDDAKAFTAVGKSVETGDKRSGYDAMFDMEVTKFKGDFTITQKIKTSNPNQPIAGYLTFMTCDDSKCLPPEDIDFVIIPAEEKAIAFAANTGTPKGKQASLKEPVNACIEKQTLGSLWKIFLLGMIGGFIAILTPCVFPMIPLTVGYFTKGKVSKAKGVTNAIIFGLSIIAIYVTLGTALTLAFGPQIMNAISTNMWLNLLFFFLFVIFAISFFGYFEITLPSSWGNATDRMADKGGLIGIFFMAFTLGIVSFSCTGPIIGTLLVESFNGTGPALFGGRLPLAPPAGMLGFAVALALPFTLFAAFPSWLKTLPRSGGWMTTVKVVLGFLELALALKFLSLVDLTQHWGILKYEVFMALWILIFALMGLYLFGAFRFPHDSPKGTPISMGRKGFGLASLLFATYLCLGLTTDKELGTYNALSVMSGLAPSTQYAIFKDDHSNDCPLKLDCFKDYEEGLAHAKAVQKPIMLDFTGYGCVNCRKMEEHVWPREGVLDKLKEDYVLISLYVDDKKKLAEPYISDFDGKKKRTIGNKWADFQAKNFDNNSQPYYVLLSHDGEQLLTNPTGYPEEGSNTGKAKFFDKFLQCGLDAFYGKVCTECKPKEGDKRLGMNDLQNK